MKVNRRSWHYRAVDFVFSWGGPSRNLCLYFWQVVWACVWACVCAPLLAIFFAVWASTPFWWWAMPEILPMAFTGAFFEIFILCILWREYRSDLRWKGKLPTKRRKGRETKYPSLFAEWVRAKKQKICPILEFE